MNTQSFTSEEESALRDTLKRCSANTIEKAVEFRKTRNVDLIGDVIIGIIERYAEPDKKAMLQNPSDSLIIVDDLGLDSMTMLEVVLSVEDAIGTTIAESDVQGLRTLGDIKEFIKKTVA